MQDKVDSKSQGFSASYGIGLGEHAVKQGNKTGVKDGIYTSSIGLGYNQGSVEQKITTRPSSFIAGAGELEVGQKVKQVGSLIDGGFTLNTKEYEVENVKDVNKETNFGINLTIYPGVSQIYENGRPTAETVAGIAIGTQLQYGSKDYEAINQATIGKNVKVLIEGKEADLSGINRDAENMVKVTKDKTVEQIDIDLSSENWGTSYGREKFKGELADATNNVDRVVQVAKATFEKGANPITLFQDRIAYEEARDSGVLDEYFGALLDSEKAKGFINDLGYDVEDVQIISLDDPNIKEILGAEAIAGRVYYTKDGSKIIIIADNARDMANAMGTLGEEARHSYYRNEKGMTDSEKYASFYGEQIERYLRSEYGSPLAILEIDELKYAANELGRYWEDASILYHREKYITGGLGHIAIEVNGNVYTFGRYGRTWGSGGTQGEGVLFKIDKQVYLKYYTQKEDVYEYVLTTDKNKDNIIENYFENWMKNGSKSTFKSKTQKWDGKILTRDYDVDEWNCTIITEKSLNAAGIGFGKMISPGLYGKNLDNIYYENGLGHIVINNKLYQYGDPKYINLIREKITHGKSK